MQELKWFENADTWNDMHQLLFNKDRMRSSFFEVNKLIRLSGIREGGSVLDLCCGIGRHSVEWARKGYIVTGVDLNAHFLEIAREKMETEGLDARFLESDMREFCEPEAFDLIINMFTSFGYFEDEQDNLKVARNAYCSLKGNGKFIIELLGKEVVAATFRERDWFRLEDSLILSENKLSDDWDWLECKWTIIRGSAMNEVIYSHKLYSAAELKRILKASGFETINAYGDLSGSPYDNNAKALLMIAQK